MLGLDAWSLGDGQYLLDDTNVNYNEIAAQVQAAQPKPNETLPSGGAQPMFSLINGSGGTSVYLTNLVVTPTNGSMTVTFSIAGGTNGFAYDMYETTNLLNSPVYSQWSWLGQGYTSNSYTFTNQPSGNAFYALAIPRHTMVVAWGADEHGQCNVPPGLTNAIDVAAGYDFSMALKAGGTLLAWGDNEVGETNLPPGLTNVIAIAAGAYHGLALLQNGSVKAWGWNQYGQTNVPLDLTNAIGIAAGYDFSAALRGDGTVEFWGNDEYGQTNAPPLGAVQQIATGWYHSVALLTNGNVASWGIVDGTDTITNVPAGLSNVVSVSAGGYHTLALGADGIVTAWGAGTSNSDFENYGQCIVPPGLSNVAAVAGGGFFSMALQSNGTVMAWGDDGFGEIDIPDGMTGVKAIAGGGFHALAIRSGDLAPVIFEEPQDQYSPVGGIATFSSEGVALDGVQYQWQTAGVNIPGATNSSLVLTNVQTTNVGNYQVILSDEFGSITSSVAGLNLVTAPVVISPTNLTVDVVSYQGADALTVSATAPGESNGFPLSYQWQFDGTNIDGATSATYNFVATNSGIYTVIVSNVVGTATASWQIVPTSLGGVVEWGSNSNGQLNASLGLTNFISLAAGEAHGVAALDNGSVTNWGSYWTGTNFVGTYVIPILTNAIAVAAGSRHDLALLANGTVVAWGLDDSQQTNVPPGLTNATAIAAGGQQSLALLNNQTVVPWGQTNGPIPAGLTNVTAIAAGTNFCLALLSNTTVVAWGDNTYGETNIPAGLSNVVAIAAGGAHALALQQNGTVVAWGDNGAGETNVPVGLSNVMGIAAGDAHCLALLNTGTVVAWGDNTFGETNVLSGLSNVKLIAAGGSFSLASEFSPLVMYPINVPQDLLLIYNTNSTDSLTVLNYYLQNRPLVSNANVLGIGFLGVFVTNGGQAGSYALITNTTVYETITSIGFTNQILEPIQTWLNSNPTKHPQYVILFLDVPSRIDDSAATSTNYPFDYGGDEYPSVSYQLTLAVPSWSPFITHINMNGTNDCIAYINKIAYVGTNYSTGKLIISGGVAQYGNTNYYFDNTGQLPILPNVSGLNASNAVVQAGASPVSVIYTNVPDDGLQDHLTSGLNLAGYLSEGVHSTLQPRYAINGDVQWSGNSGWWIIETLESFNGQRFQTFQGNFVQWFSTNAFGGTKYSNTPIGAVSHVNEPFEQNINDVSMYFGLWESEKNFAICAWNSRLTPNFQMVGDPFVIK